MTIEKLKEALVFVQNELSVMNDEAVDEQTVSIIKATLEAVIEQATPDDNGLCKCPFCGGKMSYSQYGSGAINVFCDNPENAYDDHACHFKPEFSHCDFDSLEAALKAANTRALITTIEEKMK